MDLLERLRSCDVTAAQGFPPASSLPQPSPSPADEQKKSKGERRAVVEGGETAVGILCKYPSTSQFPNAIKTSNYHTTLHLSVNKAAALSKHTTNGEILVLLKIAVLNCSFLKDNVVPFALKFRNFQTRRFDYLPPNSDFKSSPSPLGVLHRRHHIPKVR
ncbi:phosphoribosylformylglycinamidine cyclo-ligase [Striga asiatica]|uniref:Phosphoribosylformylglycinamidine cyclo-ligase n=1 Tax=Striga asiatica TaxID=4170 RepID=A0A5A7PZE8_STRAF|nr:phosphoribosylformylglycinamidine cyclo-ligase [Striga asiatica]